MSPLKGLSAFPITPADAAGRVDTVAQRRLIDRLTAAGVDSIGLLGSTGIYMYLTREERRRAMEAAQEQCGKTPLVVGVGALRTGDAARLAQDAKAMGAAVGLLSPVSYAPLSQDEVFEHFSAVARESGLPICIYDNPGTTHFTFMPELVSRLSRVPGIVGIKNPPPEGEMVRHLRDQRSGTADGFSIGYSDDWCCPTALMVGADCWYGVLGGTLPKVCLAITRAAQAEDLVEAQRLDTALAPVWGLFRKYTSQRTVYEIIRQLGLSDAEPPRPILPVCEAGKQDIAAVLRGLPAGMAK
ncbi:4-hydroxy-tetrahydrodipicolinate synthase [Paracoccus alcaliphilus]|uniref:4-hydroxy-tetrahydrodipicolinate synthase n=1 Tax=Paracoccus alcaliphilus TaxID=34002 RepID=A0A1H8NFT4_9RHOB|nr:dihydrodipicolinate synthase family protein [Paracoccus alcaliphilus]WCR19879.1 dihydrodipicolinate synthase family protein [Paracoccus alcaliphilus]SEO28465.1 4-hydroxy-tetrahydrodipicolinate synthase [Paracoccus alcaliphilus]